MPDGDRDAVEEGAVVSEIAFDGGDDEELAALKQQKRDELQQLRELKLRRFGNAMWSAASLAYPGRSCPVPPSGPAPKEACPMPPSGCVSQTAPKAGGALAAFEQNATPLLGQQICLKMLDEETPRVAPGLPLVLKPLALGAAPRTPEAAPCATLPTERMPPRMLRLIPYGAWPPEHLPRTPPRTPPVASRRHVCHGGAGQAGGPASAQKRSRSWSSGPCRRSAVTGSGVPGAKTRRRKEVYEEAKKVDDSEDDSWGDWWPAGDKGASKEKGEDVNKEDDSGDDNWGDAWPALAKAASKDKGEGVKKEVDSDDDNWGDAWPALKKTGENCKKEDDRDGDSWGDAWPGSGKSRASTIAPSSPACEVEALGNVSCEIAGTKDNQAPNSNLFSGLGDVLKLARHPIESRTTFEMIGTMREDKGAYGFIKHDVGEDDIFVLPTSCQAFGGVFPPWGTRVVCRVVRNELTGKPLALEVRQCEVAEDVAARNPAKEQETPDEGSAELIGTVYANKGGYGFIRQDATGDDMFVIPAACQAFGGALPPLGSRVVFVVGVSAKTGKATAEDVRPLDEAKHAAARIVAWNQEASQVGTTVKLNGERTTGRIVGGVRAYLEVGATSRSLVPAPPSELPPRDVLEKLVASHASRILKEERTRTMLLTTLHEVLQQRCAKVMAGAAPSPSHDGLLGVVRRRPTRFSLRGAGRATTVTLCVAAGAAAAERVLKRAWVRSGRSGREVLPVRRRVKAQSKPTLARAPTTPPQSRRTPTTKRTAKASAKRAAAAKVATAAAMAAAHAPDVSSTLPPWRQQA